MSSSPPHPCRVSLLSLVPRSSEAPGTNPPTLVITALPGLSPAAADGRKDSFARRTPRADPTR